MNVNEYIIRPLLGFAGTITLFSSPDQHAAHRGRETQRHDRVAADVSDSGPQHHSG